MIAAEKALQLVRFLHIGVAKATATARAVRRLQVLDLLPAYMRDGYFYTLGDLFAMLTLYRWPARRETL